MGASFETGNMGVSALAASLVKIIREIKPNAEISFLVGNKIPKVRDLEISGQKIKVKVINYRLSPKSKLQEHLFWILLLACLQRLVPLQLIKKRVIKSNP